MTEQFALPLPVTATFARADFLVSESNHAAFDLIERWPDWPSRALVLFGPAGSGKTHLAHLWCERSDGALIADHKAAIDDPTALPSTVAIDDVDRADERSLLHLYNVCIERGGSLLLTLPTPPAALPIALADLASRLRALPVVGIGLPDDALLAAVLVKQFTDRQLRVAPEVLAYLMPRIERSFAAVVAIAARLDRMSLEVGRPITIKLARAVLAESSQSSPPSDLTVT